MNIHVWESLLEGYWDKQLLECLKFGFPLGFNRTCSLNHDKQNHKSAVEFPEHVSKYIEEEKNFGAIIGPFEKSPIKNLHYSPFMTRNKPNSENRRVLLDLSWPRGESVNAGVEKNGYMGYDFQLMFPTIDDLTQELVKIGKGAHVLLDIMTQQGLTVSDKKLVEPTTSAVCLGILIDTVQGTVAIPPEKLEVIRQMIKEWKGRKLCTKRQLQSFLGTLLYVHKCVKPARYFLNRMLTTLHNVSNPARVRLDQDFLKDLNWFDKFLPLYAHVKSQSILELDACLMGLGVDGTILCSISP